ncbi:dihydroorotate dehydrogenase (plasmid) [Nitratireductor sp. L1-7-SE]|jgi:dihydroorotate dehydrogenase (NAD+) catalytic subunit|uniref:Dihydroorotate dehydrogenase n=1 Tax=Nitratireductor rhodophyticola TaxID=2854036 RepID=A0ABS7RD25_9HYPH|nr:dihydroorotate dehydrogenase [Nitratireductor rhodophyticola]MAS13711.1 dihydroorotate dehydrogenase B catalytic subunit [Nitratireductor sp.]MBY8918534.1 dihydroorotate dehydrogenase [Nitratireductor rhodophyticola]MBY8922877.1 dihydroorotate dehydrogenase [Nitratireductor rhodophyticola]
MVDLSVDISGLKLKNPIMPASGTFSEDLAEVFDLDRLGAHVTKTITRGWRDGNPTPRVCEVNGSMLNSIGIPSKGVGAFIEKVVPFYAHYETPLVVSISGNTADEFATLCSEVSVPGVAAIEVNISCPNIEEDGKAFAIRPSSTHDVMRKLRAATDLPLWAKLTPNTGETSEVARAAEEAGADALVVANTILSMAIDINTRRPKLGNLMGGLSGPSLKPIALRMAYQCARATSIPVIGCGGISTVEDVIEYLIAGASAVQVGTATFIHPTIMLSLIDGLEDWLSNQGLSSVKDLIGTVIDGEQDEAVVFMEAAP